MRTKGHSNERYERLAVGRLRLEVAPYQRRVSPERLEELRPRVKSHSINTIAVSLRSDGTYVVVDGQHRVQLCLDTWGPGYLVMCLVREGLSGAEEAAWFGELNDHRGLVSYTRFNADFIAGYAYACEIVKILESHGLRAAANTSDHTLSAVKALAAVHELGVLDATIGLLKAAWGFDRGAWNGNLLEGFGLFLHRHPEADLESLRRKLAGYGGPDLFLGNSKTRSKVTRGLSVKRSVAAEAVDLYNVRRSDKSKLPPWS